MFWRTFHSCSRLIRFLACLAICCSFEPARADEPIWIRYPAGQRFEIGPADESVRISLDLEKKVKIKTKENDKDVEKEIELKPDKIQVTLLDAAFGNRHDVQYYTAFVPSLSIAPNRLPAVEVKITAGKAELPGEYSLLLRLDDSEHAELKPLTSTIQLVRPAPQLSVPATLKIVNVHWPLTLFPDQTVNPVLQVRETSSKASLHEVTIRQLSSSLASGEPSDLNIQANIKETIPAGKTYDIDYEVKGKPPLGTVNGQLELVSAQLSNAPAINFEVKTRLTYWILFITILGGMLSGYLLRTYLQSQAELSQLDIQAAKLLLRARQEIDRIKDADFALPISPLVHDLEQAITAQDAALIKQATESLNTTLDSQLKAHASRLAALLTELARLQSVVRANWSVPASIREDLGLAGTKLDAIKTKLDTTRDVSAELTNLQNFTNGLAADLDQEASEWKRRTLTGIESLLQGARSLPAPIQAFWREQDKALRSLLDQLVLNDPHPAAETLLSAVHKCRVSF